MDSTGANASYFLSPLVAATLTVVLAGLVVQAGLREHNRRVFLLVLLSLVSWALFTFGMRNSPTLEAALLWERPALGLPSGPVRHLLSLLPRVRGQPAPLADRAAVRPGSAGRGDRAVHEPGRRGDVAHRARLCPRGRPARYDRIRRRVPADGGQRDPPPACPAPIRRPGPAQSFPGAGDRRTAAPVRDARRRLHGSSPGGNLDPPRLLHRLHLRNTPLPPLRPAGDRPQGA